MIRKFAFALTFLLVSQISFGNEKIASENIAISSSTTIESTTFSGNSFESPLKRGRKKKSGRYKKRRRLFKKKSGCDCPKH